MTIKQAAQQALDVQDACNASGIAHSMLDCMAAIRADESNTVSVNRHPIVTMFLLKLSELNGCGSSLHASYEPAEIACKALAVQNG